MECIVLAGGLGTRLRDSIGEQPKCMAPVNEKPFLYYILQYLATQQCTRVVLSLGYQHQVVLQWLEQTQWPFEIAYVIEGLPLGTGGGIQLALREAKHAHVAVLNGDTLFQVDMPALMQFHLQHSAEATLALKPMRDFDRYGVVYVDEEACIKSFEEKQATASGLINGGVYILDREAVPGRLMPEKFSFEKDYLEAYVGEGKFYGHVDEGYFIDIGIPADYERAQTDFKTLFPA